MDSAGVRSVTMSTASLAETSEFAVSVCVVADDVSPVGDADDGGAMLMACMETSYLLLLDCGGRPRVDAACRGGEGEWLEPDKRMVSSSSSPCSSCLTRFTFAGDMGAVAAGVVVVTTPFDDAQMLLATDVATECSSLASSSIAAPGMCIAAD